jgi:hypothetical protein
LPTYRGGNDREKAGDEKATRAAFNGGGDSVRWHSGSKDSSDGGGIGGGSSSKRRIGTGGFGVAARPRWRDSAMATRVWMATTLAKAPIYRGRVRHRELGLQVDSIPSLSSKSMKFAQISQRGFLDTGSVLILAVRGGVWFDSDCLRVLSVYVTRSRVSHGVEAMRVA